MPLASWFSLHWYGPAAGAAILPGAGALAGDIRAFGEPTATVSGVGSVPLAKPTRLVNRPATLAGVGVVSTASPRARARVAATIKVNTLSQDDVTGAVLEAQVLPGLTLKQALVDARRAAKLAAALSA